MCILFLFVNSNPSPGGYKLILASNREEFYARPTAPAAQWSGAASHAYGGIDLEPGREGGTWLGISGRDGIIKVGALLNLTGEPKCPNDEGNLRKTNSINKPVSVHNHSIGRGPIVTNFITGQIGNEEYTKSLLDKTDRFSAFNFVSAEIRSDGSSNILYCSNTPNTIESCAEDKCHGFSNSLHSSPFEKTREGQMIFNEIVHNYKNKSDLVEQCHSLLRNPKKHWPDDELKRRAPNWGNHLSSINVRIPEAGYGTRTHTVILVDENNNMDLYEETMTTLDPAGEWTKTHLTASF